MEQMLNTRDTVEYGILRTTAAEYAEKVLSPLAEQLDQAQEPPLKESMDRVEELGALHALIDERAGGGGLDDYAFCLVLEEMAVESAGAATALLVHNAALLSVAMMGEPGSLLDSGFPICFALPGTLSLSGGSVTGFVPWAFNAPTATRLTVLVPESGGVASAILEPEVDGVSISPHPNQLGLKAARVASIEFNGAVPSSVLRGDAGVLTACERILHLGFAAVSTGIARKSFQEARAYASERYQGGAIIIDHQQMRLFLADMLSGLEMAQAMIKAACQKEDLASALACRIEVTDRALRSATDGVQIHGGYGYTMDYGMERLMRDATYCQIYPRTNEESRLQLLELAE